jgi:nitrogen fixation NifU-like protein
MYTNKVIQFFKHPHNVGKIKNPDGLGKAGNPVCGDVMWIYIKAEKNKKGEEIINDIKFSTFGCAVAIACSSVVTDLAKGKRLEDAKKITKEEVAKKLGKLPQYKYHCSILAVDALKKAIQNYEKKKAK